MRKLLILSLAVLGTATTAAEGGTLLARLRTRERARIDVRDSLDGVVEAVAYQTQSEPTLALPALPSYQPTPADPTPPGPAVMPAPIPDMPVPATLTLYSNVKVRSPRAIAPCAVPMIVSAPDPCNPCCQVCVEICVPPCIPAEVKCRRDGQKIVYDFGKYEVKVSARRDFVLVDYDR